MRWNTNQRRFVAATVFCVIMPGAPARSQSIASLRVGDPSTSLSVLGTPAATDESKGMKVRRWVLPNGNELSVTTSPSGPIVYIESDWNPGKPGSTGCDLPGLRFGDTTLAELRKRFGSNGFAFTDRGGQMLAQDGAVMLNSYEAGGFVITFYNKVSNQEATQLNPEGQGTIADHARLDAISIASPEYAKQAWGDRVYDPQYKTIDWK